MNILKDYKEQLSGIRNFVKRYWILCALTLLAFIISALLPSWNFIAYGVAKTLCALATGLLLRNVFLTTIDKYIDSGDFRKEFLSASPNTKVCVAAGSALILFLGACICFS